MTVARHGCVLLFWAGLLSEAFSLAGRVAVALGCSAFLARRGALERAFGYRFNLRAPAPFLRGNRG
jgi:hypothetical protein